MDRALAAGTLAPAISGLNLGRICGGAATARTAGLVPVGPGIRTTQARTATASVVDNMAVIEEVDENSVSLLRVKEDMLRRRGAQLTTEGDDAPAWHDADEEDEGPMLEEDTAQWLYEEVEDAKLPDSVAFVLDLVSWSIPFVFAFELLNLLVQKQYNHETTVLDEIRTLLSRIPRTCIVD